MKYLLTIALLLITLLDSKADVGCSDGTYIYITPTGNYIYENATTAVPKYNSSDRIYIRNWSGDACGISRDIVNTYSRVTTSNNPNGSCAIGNNYGSGLVNYNPRDNTCNTSLPLDGFTWILFIIVGGYATYMLTKRKSIL